MCGSLSADASQTLPVRILVIIPAFNEAGAIARVIGDIPAGLAHEVVVVNNASTDRTAINAKEAGATVVSESRRGYGFACLRGMAYAAQRNPDIVVFLDGDYSDHPDEMGALVDPILRQEADFVVGSRTRGMREPGALLPQAIVGNWLACRLIRWRWGVRYSDLGPFRAIRYADLLRLNMRDKTFGWTIEMQIKAHLAGLRIMEIPVSYRRRTGISKITGTVSGTVRASARILWTLFRFSLGSGKLVRSIGSPVARHSR